MEPKKVEVLGLSGVLPDRAISYRVSLAAADSGFRTLNPSEVPRQVAQAFRAGSFLVGLVGNKEVLMFIALHHPLRWVLVMRTPLAPEGRTCGIYIGELDKIFGCTPGNPGWWRWILSRPGALFRFIMRSTPKEDRRLRGRAFTLMKKWVRGEFGPLPDRLHSS